MEATVNEVKNVIGGYDPELEVFTIAVGSVIVELCFAEEVIAFRKFIRHESEWYRSGGMDLTWDEADSDDTIRVGEGLFLCFNCWPEDQAAIVEIIDNALPAMPSVCEGSDFKIEFNPKLLQWEVLNHGYAYVVARNDTLAQARQAVERILEERRKDAKTKLEICG